MTTLLTGASGFIGSALARRLLAAGHDVRVLVRPTSDRRNIEGLPVDLALGDLRDRISLERACTGCDTLFHVAADYRLWSPDPRAMYESNVVGTENLLQAAAWAGVQRIVYTSTVATLGFARDGVPADESTPPCEGDMIGDYKRSKYLAERWVRQFAKDSGIPVIVVHPSTPIGPRDLRPTPTGRIIVEALRGRIPAYVDTGLNVVHVDDVAQGHVLALEKGRAGEGYILGGENRSLRDILGAIAELAGRRAPRVRLSPTLVLPVAYVAEAYARLRRRFEPLTTVVGVKMSRKLMYYSIDKARRELSYAPRPAAEALADAAQWFRSHGYCS